MLLSDSFIIEDGIHPLLFEGEYETYSLDCCNLIFKLNFNKKIIIQKQLEYDLKKLIPASYVPAIVKVSKKMNDQLLAKIMSNDLFLWNLNKLDEASKLEYDLHFVGLDLVAATIFLKTKKNEDVFKLDVSMENKMAKEAINHPDHYGGVNNPYEAIKVIEALNFNFHIGNVFKYISRAGKKIDELNQSEQLSLLKDLKKARWYLDRYITLVENSTEIKIKNDKDK